MNDPGKSKSIYCLDYYEIIEFFTKQGMPEYRARQIWKGLYQNLYDNWDSFTSLPKSLRSLLTSNFDFLPIEPQLTLFNADNSTIKVLFYLQDNSPIESVLMKSGKRWTLCLSTQSGCAMGCVFCATGKMGLQCNLSTAEIVSQVIYFLKYLKAHKRSLTNIVFMGMGEPFNNYDPVTKAINIINDSSGINLGARRITVSTIGIIPKIYQFSQDQPQVNLAISLHAPEDELRSKLVPINKKYPLSNLIAACHDYVNITHRRISFEYILIAGVNDSLQQAKQLGHLLRNLLCHVNLIGFNPIDNTQFLAPSKISIEKFANQLSSLGVQTTIRKSMGVNIHAGCGQLAGK